MGYRYRLCDVHSHEETSLIFASRKKVIFIRKCIQGQKKCGQRPFQASQKNLQNLEIRALDMLAICEHEAESQKNLREKIASFLEQPIYCHSQQKRQVNYDTHNTQSFTVTSFFAGCGGLDLGFLGGFTYKESHLQRLPFKILSAYENDPKCIMTYQKNIGDHIKIEDLSKANPSDMPESDILIGGFPCQDFSSCGPQGGLASKRGRLYKAMLSYMQVHQPKIVIGENVIHLLRMEKGKIAEKIIRDFESAGYRFDIWRLFAPEYGVPQNRERVFFIGVRQDIKGKPEKPIPTHIRNYRSIDWAIGDLISVTDESVPNQSQYFKASKARRGNGQGDEQNKPGQPSYTIRANAKSRVQFHHELPRRLTVRECARLQTFPDTFSFPHSATTNIMQIGNAVPPLLAYYVACSIKQFLSTVEMD
jgi:DNA (cytosine-5)-methyltransferase 1